MKLVLVIALVACVFSVGYVKAESTNYRDCYNSLENECARDYYKSSNIINCSAKVNNYDDDSVQSYVMDLLSKSYKYLFLATRFGSYQKNRSGFQKLYQGLSDKHFDEAIDLIKHINKRGGNVNMQKLIESAKNFYASPHYLDKDELHSLGVALDTEKELFEKASHIHNHAIHDTVEKLPHYKTRDPEIAHYIEEKFLGSQADTVRKLAGYLNDLSKIIGSKNEIQLGVYLFDEYLQKQ